MFDGENCFDLVLLYFFHHTKKNQQIKEIVSLSVSHTHTQRERERVGDEMRYAVRAVNYETNCE